MQALTHRVQYYETDRMGVTHHSNYIRFMEEARVAYLEQLGFPYAELERRGVISPVTAVNCKYLATTTFDDRITVDVRVEAFNGVVLTIGYDMTKQDGTRVFTGSSEHCFLNPRRAFHSAAARSEGVLRDADARAERPSSSGRRNIA